MIVFSDLKHFLLVMLLFFISCKKEIKNTDDNLVNKKNSLLKIKAKDEKEITIDGFVNEFNKNLKNFNGDYISKILNSPVKCNYDFEEHSYQNYQELRDKFHYF